MKGETYRLLALGEFIQDGDQWLDNKCEGLWHTTLNAGSRVGEPQCNYTYRRKVSESDAQQPIAFDPVNRPAHYLGHPSGVECIQITEHMNFCRGNAVKYCFRSGSKADAIEDLRKGKWYANRELENISAGLSLRCVGLGESSEQVEWSGAGANTNQEWLHDLYVFLSACPALRARNGSGNIRVGTPEGIPSIAPERDQVGQPSGEPPVGERHGQLAPQETAQHRTDWTEPLERKTDRGSGDLGEDMPDVSDKGRRGPGSVAGDSGQNTFWGVLATFISSVSTLDRAVFYLSVGQIEKAIHYIDREIERLAKKEAVK